MNQQKIIVPTGYMGSGSSAITDLLREYSSLNTKNADFEYIFLHAPSGVFDLEKKLLLNNNAVRSDEAIKEFRALMEKLFHYRGWWPAGYKNAVSDRFLIIVEEFIDSIKTTEFEGNWYIYERPSYLIYIYRAILKRVGRFLGINLTTRKSKKVHLEMSLIEEDEFYINAKRFIEKVIDEINPSHQDIVLDQLLLPHNLSGFQNYGFDNVFPIVVQRDPRDVFISNKYFWAPKNNGVPYPLDVEEFCKYYKAIRMIEKNTTVNCLKINFEDLVLNYEDSVKRIEEYLTLDSQTHSSKFKFMDPQKSISNLQIFATDEKFQMEVKIIEERLKEYLYDFPELLKNKNNEIF